MTESVLKKVRRALISVSHKEGIVEFARALTAHGIELVSTGGTARLLRTEGMTVRDVSELTGFPEMLDGRVKTLHPKVHGGILSIRENVTHREQAAAHGIEPIDMVVVNLYPFLETISKPRVTLEEAIENIDIGGPAMIRSAAKNHHDVAVVVEAADYQAVTKQLEANDGATTLEFRYQLAARAYALTAAYDREIARYLSRSEQGEGLPEAINLDLRKLIDLRYGENPHQRAALYSLEGAEKTGVATAKQLQGKELSYNNLLDSDAAWSLASEMYAMVARDARAAGATDPGALPCACVIIKHTNPCGVGIGTSAAAAFSRAKASDPLSAFGGIIAVTKEIDTDAARSITELFSEVVLAPGFSPGALEVFAAKKNLRLLQMIHPAVLAEPRLELRRISGGVLVQETDSELLDEEKLEIVTERKPTPTELRALRFAWAICKHVKSNAIVYASEGQLVAIGAGQMSRIDSVRLGAMKAQLPLEGSVLASDAFFPFRDGVDEAAKNGITAIIQPGGSIQDSQSIEAANEHGIAMVMTGMRHFKH